MIQQLFPNRTRQQIKQKYKIEERKHPLQVHDAILHRSNGMQVFLLFYCSYSFKFCQLYAITWCLILSTSTFFEMRSILFSLFLNSRLHDVERKVYNTFFSYFSFPLNGIIQSCDIRKFSNEESTTWPCKAELFNILLTWD